MNHTSESLNRKLWAVSGSDQFGIGEALLTEPSAVAPGRGLSSVLNELPKVNSSIRRYRVRFCKQSVVSEPRAVAIGLRKNCVSRRSFPQHSELILSAWPVATVRGSDMSDLPTQTDRNLKMIQ
jgi:hypothetical protein